MKHSSLLRWISDANLQEVKQSGLVRIMADECNDKSNMEQLRLCLGMQQMNF